MRESAMNIADVVYYVAVGLPLVWLAWLVVRPFLSRLNRMLFVVFGMALYGYFAKVIVVPMNDILSAHLTAKQSMVALGYPAAVESNEVAATFALYVIPTLVIVMLLLFWLHRVLSRSPKLTPA